MQIISIWKMYIAWIDIGGRSRVVHYAWGLGWFYYLYHKNINKTLILAISRDDFCEELQMCDKIRKECLNNSDLLNKFPISFCFS
jgi:hypothetical protein